MNVYIPVSVYRVRYQVVKGRPYSLCERTLLEAIQEGNDDVEKLVSVLKINRNIVIHGVVTLMQAGWVALTTQGGATRYVTTEIGARALATPDTLPPNREVLPDRETKIVMERCWRNLCSANDVSYVAKRELKKLREDGEDFVVLAAISSVEPDAAEAFGYIPTNKTEFERILDVGPVSVFRHDADYVRIDVDPLTSAVTGLPPHWRHDSRLLAEIHEQVEAAILELDDGSELCDVLRFQALAVESGELQESVQSDDTPKSFGASSAHPCLRSEISSIVGPVAHERFFKGVLKGLAEAETFVVINSVVIHEVGVTRLLPAFQQALIRGINIDIFWSREASVDAGIHQSAVGLLRDLEKASFSSVPGRLMVARTPSRLRTNLLIADPGGNVEAVIGSYDWLDQPQSYSTSSIRIQASGVVAELSLYVSAFLYETRYMRTSFNSSRLQNIAVEFQPSTDDSEEGVFMTRVLADHHHSNVISDALSHTGPGENCVIVSSDWPSKLDSLLMKRFSAWCTENSCQFRYAFTPQGRAVAELSASGVVLERVINSKDNFLTLGTDRILIGSWNWLSVIDRLPSRSQLDLGIEIVGAGAAEILKPSGS